MRYGSRKTIQTVEVKAPHRRFKVRNLRRKIKREKVKRIKRLIKMIIKYIPKAPTTGFI